jgi:hypothetical protein
MNQPTAPQTTLFLRSCSDSVYRQVPEIFVDQARTGWQKHQIGGELFLNRSVSVELTAPSIRKDISTGEEYVAAKLKVRGIMDDKFQLVPMQTGRVDLAPGQSWLKGHYSPELRFDLALVRAGYITPEELEALIRYEALWKSMGTQQYDTAVASPGAKPNSKKRLYLTAKDTSSKFQFFYTVRTNPKTGEETIGIQEIGWVGMHLIGTTTGGIVERIADAVDIIASGDTGLDRSRAVAAPSVEPLAAGRPRV